MILKYNVFSPLRHLGLIHFFDSFSCCDFFKCGSFTASKTYFQRVLGEFYFGEFRWGGHFCCGAEEEEEAAAAYHCWLIFLLRFDFFACILTLHCRFLWKHSHDAFLRSGVGLGSGVGFSVGPRVSRLRLRRVVCFHRLLPLQGRHGHGAGTLNGAVPAGAGREEGSGHHLLDLQLSVHASFVLAAVL